ncbi:hypothetical protein CK203_005188 [Vitis vinifera]|uniref:Uncharacterized protein n=1 Tax=Vitis vinifera TaxID=29760 RepID=A0A438KEL5_VITVI|nr:hypothetical protein CK203_005188 [Vitis vinifera]
MGQNLLHQLFEKPTDDFKRQEKRLETELELTRESLRMKELEVLAAQRALTIKDEELKIALERLDAREKELRRMKEEMMEDANHLKNLYALAQERIEMSCELLHNVSLSVDSETDTAIFLPNGFDPWLSMHENNEHFTKVKTEVARLSAITDQLVQEAGVVGAAN